MNGQVKVEQTPQVMSPQPANSTGPSDADLQALWDIGELQFLANTYEDLVSKGSPQPQTGDALAEFQKLYSYYQFSNVNGTFTVNFNYNEANPPQYVAITDPDILAILQQLPTLSNPPTAADVATFQNALYSTTKITWSDGQQETLLERMLMVTYDSQYSMGNNVQNTITNTSFLLFYLSIVNAPGNIASGLLDNILSEGYFDGAMFNFGNIRAIAQVLRDHLANDSNLLTYDVILAGLQITTKDPLYNLLAELFQNDTANGSNEGLDWQWESRFFPVINSENLNPAAVIPDTQNSYLENRVELEKKEMSQRSHTDARPYRIRAQ